MSYISFTPKISIYNDFTRDNYYDNIFTSIYSLLNTPKGSHPYDPEFGVDLRSMIFKHDKGDLKDMIKDSVNASLRRYLPDYANLVYVVCDRELHESGIGFKYSLILSIENIFVRFGISKEGRVMYSGIKA